MTLPLFTELPEQRPGPISVDGHTLVTCWACRGHGGAFNSSGKMVMPSWFQCPKCNGGGQILERTP